VKFGTLYEMFGRLIVPTAVSPRPEAGRAPLRPGDGTDPPGSGREGRGDKPRLYRRLAGLLTVWWHS
jgi:hypothetical protein